MALVFSFLRLCAYVEPPPDPPAGESPDLGDPVWLAIGIL